MPLRLRRYQQEGHHHFITFSCYRLLPHLNTEAAYTTLEHCLETLRQRHIFDVHSYVLMPEHVHRLLNEPNSDRPTPSTTPSELSKAKPRKTSASKTFNKKAAFSPSLSAVDAFSLFNALPKAGGKRRGTIELPS